MRGCETCKLRAAYDRNPAGLLGKIWKWHIRWCPGWQSYLNSLADERRMDILEKYK